MADSSVMESVQNETTKFEDIVTGPAQNERMKLIILNTIDKIRNRKKKRPGKEKIIKYACSEYGLSEKDAVETLKLLESKQAIRVEINKEGNDSYFICEDIKTEVLCQLEHENAPSCPDAVGEDDADEDEATDDVGGSDSINDEGYPIPPSQQRYDFNAPVLENYVTEKAKTVQDPDSAINMANAVVKLADTISELHQMLRIERARSDSLMADNFSLKSKNQELEILIENILGSQKQESKTTSTLTQKTLEIHSNLIKGAEQNQQKRGGKTNETSYNTSIHNERQGKAQTTIHKESGTNATKQSEETQELNSNVHRGINLERYRTPHGNNITQSNRVPYNTTATKQTEYKMAKSKRNTQNRQQHRRSMENNINSTSQPNNSLANERSKDAIHICMVGDSQLLRLDSDKMSNKHHEVVLNAKSGMKVEEAANHVDPDADVIIMHAGTNNLRDLTPEEVAEKVMKTFKNIKKRNPKAQLAYSSNFRRKGAAAANGMNVKAFQTNKILKEELMLLGIDFIDNDNILYGNICEDGLHINQGGAKRFARNFRKYVEYW